MQTVVRSFFFVLNQLPALFGRRSRPPDAPAARQSIHVRLMRPTPHQLRRALCRLAGAGDMTVAGAFGSIRGSVDDHAILETYARTRTWCPVENDFFTALFDRHGGGTYLDIGANIGLTTIPVARNRAVSCLAFEPEPANFRYLRQNVALNCGSNVELFSLALFDRRTRLELQLSPTNKGDHRVLSRRAEGAFVEAVWPVIRVDAERLDDVLAGRTLAEPLAVKIVAQGAEPQIVAGGVRTLARAAALLVEIYPHVLRRSGGEVAFLLGFVAEHFNEGAIIPGGSAAAPYWTPVAELAEAVRARMVPGISGPAEYFHVFLRK